MSSFLGELLHSRTKPRAPHAICDSQPCKTHFATKFMQKRCWDPKAQWDREIEVYLSAVLGEARFQAISAAIVRPPLATCLRVNTLRYTSEDVLHRLKATLKATNPAFVETAHNNPALEPYIQPSVPMAIIVPGSGPHEVDYSSTNGLEVIVGRKAGEAMLRGANAYAPGILACTNDIAAGDLVAVSVGVELSVSGSLSTPTFGVTRGSVVPRHLSLDDPRFPQRSKLFLGVGKALVPRTSMNPNSNGLVVTLTDRVFQAPALGGIMEGELMLQNLPSLLAAVVLDPTPGSRVLDMCAAPGGKTTAMAQIMKDQGEIIALDRSHSKVLGILSLAQELGITCIQAFKADATRVVRGWSNLRQPTDKSIQEPKSERAKARAARLAALRSARGEDPLGPPKADTVPEGFEQESFDFVLLDAPCTALGLRPRLSIPHTLQELRSTASYQRRLLDAAVRLVKPGGCIVFSTCTINPGENETNVRYVLDSYGSFLRLVPQRPVLGGPGLKGSYTCEDGRLENYLKDEESPMVQRFDPSAELDTIGFFIAKFEKFKSTKMLQDTSESTN